jgi:hypothetical protein
MIKYKQPASIQGAILSLRARRFNPYPPSKHETLGFMLYKFKLSDTSSAVIKKELEPKECFWREKESLLDVDDGIAGEIIRGFTESPFKPGLVRGSGAHRAQGADTPEGRNFAELDRVYTALFKLEPEIPITHQR